MVGVGFKKADIFAGQLGISPDDPMRLDAGLVFQMKEI